MSPGPAKGLGPTPPNRLFWGCQPSRRGGGVADWTGEWMGGRGEGAVWIDPSGELFSARAGGRMVLGERARPW